MWLELMMWLTAEVWSEVNGCMLISDVDRLHVKRNRIVGMNNLGIIDAYAQTCDNLTEHQNSIVDTRHVNPARYEDHGSHNTKKTKEYLKWMVVRTHNSRGTPATSTHAH